MSHTSTLFMNHSVPLTCGIDATDNITLTLNGLLLAEGFKTSPEVSVSLQLENGEIPK